MPFISYAQNYEDVILWRALRDVENGFYVDVGAADPTELSVTRAFYDRGWSGINIEPTEPYFSELQAERPRDVNLRVLAGSRAGVRILHVIKGTGLSTIDDNFAARQVKAGFASCDVVAPQLELNQILQLRAAQPIQFLKVDVEGAEAEVLAGIDLKRFRPWIILLEATKPLSQEPTRQNWEGLLLRGGYDFAYFDGLNCFYVATERAALKEKLALPPNVFDDFVSFSQVRLQNELAQQTQQAAELSKAREADGEAIMRLENEVARLASEFDRFKSREIDGNKSRLAYGEAIMRLDNEVAQLANEFDGLKSREIDGIKLRLVDGEAIMRLEKEVAQFICEIESFKTKIAVAESRAQYIFDRSLLEKLLFRADGRPVKPLRRLLFHTSGAPRRSLRILVLHKNGTPRSAFAHWMGSAEHLAFRNAVNPPSRQVTERAGPATITERAHPATTAEQDNHPASPRERYFLTRLLGERSEDTTGHQQSGNV